MVTSRSLLKGTRIKTHAGETKQVLGLIIPSDPAAVVSSFDKMAQSNSSNNNNNNNNTQEGGPSASLNVPSMGPAQGKTVVFEDAKGQKVPASELCGNYHWAKVRSSLQKVIDGEEEGQTVLFRILDLTSSPRLYPLLTGIHVPRLK